MNETSNEKYFYKKLKTFSELKQTARATLNGNYMVVIPFVFCYALLTSLVIGFSSFTEYHPLLGVLPILVMTMISDIPLSLLKVGYYKMYLNLCCKREIHSGDLFYGFQLKPGRTALISIFLTSLQFLCLIPFYIYEYHFVPQSDAEYLTISMLLLGSAQVIYFFITLCFSQCYFLLLDFPTLSAKDIIKLSVKLMKGNNLRFAGLQISFLPLILLGSLSCGLGLLWVLPYQFTTYACFYLDLVASKEK